MVKESLEEPLTCCVGIPGRKHFRRGIEFIHMDEIEPIVDILLNPGGDFAEETHQNRVILGQTGTTIGVPIIPADITWLKPTVIQPSNFV
jgi:hypothetical protein